VRLSAQAPAFTISSKAAGKRGVALAGEAEVHRERIRPPGSCGKVPRTGLAGGGECAVRRAGAAPSMEVTPDSQRSVDLLRADEMDVRVEPAGGEDLALPAIHLGAGRRQWSRSAGMSGLPALPIRGRALP